MPGRRITFFGQLVPPKATWPVENVPDQTGRIAIITGGHTGVGLETARVLLSKGAKVYIATLDEEKAHEAIDELKGDTGKESVFLLKLDLADLDSVKAAAEDFMGKESQLHTLYNNGGVMVAPSERETSQGFDIVFGTNVLGHFYLTKLLLPVLTATVKKSPPGTVRVVNISSIAHYMAPSEGIRFPTLGPRGDGAAARKRLGMARVYGQSKLGNVLFSNELAKRYKDAGIVSISLFPGAVNADLQGYASSFFQRIGKLVGACVCFLISGGDLDALTEDLLHDEPSAGELRSRAVGSAQHGARERINQPVVTARGPVTPHHDPHEPTKVYHRSITSLYAGTAPQASELSGRYLTAWARVTLPSKQALNTRLAEKLWDWCEESINKAGEDTKEDVKEDVKPKPEEDIKSKPKEDIKSKPEEDTKPKEDAKLKEDAKPKEDTKPEEDAKPKEDTKPKEDVKPKEDAKPEENTKPKEDAKPEEDAKGKDKAKE